MTDDLQAMIATLGAWTEARLSPAGAEEAAAIAAEHAVRALGGLGEAAHEAVPAIVRAMHADQARMGGAAGQALGRIGGEAAIRELNRIWYSGWDRTLCQACHAALTAMGERAHPVLLRLLDASSPLERVRALRSLRVSGYAQGDLVARAVPLLGEFESPALESLIAFFGSIDDPAASAAAVSALQAIGGDSSPFNHTRALASEVIWTLTERHSGS